MCDWIVALFHPTKDDHFWTGSGISSDRSSAQRFSSKSDAFASWNDHCNTYPEWEAELREADNA